MMTTGNILLLDRSENRDYYSTSDGNFMPLEQSLQAHKGLSRVKWVREWVHNILSRRHLDVGCKDGYTCLTLQAEGIECVGIDPSSDAVDAARLKAVQANLEPVYITSFVEDYVNPKRFDSVSCMEVVEHVTDVDVLLKKLCSLGDHIFITTPDAIGRHGMKDAIRNQEHVRLFGKDELNELCFKYGEVIDIQSIDDQLFIYFIANTDDN